MTDHMHQPRTPYAEVKLCAICNLPLRWDGKTWHWVLAGRKTT